VPDVFQVDDNWLRYVENRLRYIGPLNRDNVTEPRQEGRQSASSGPLCTEMVGEHRSLLAHSGLPSYIGGTFSTATVTTRTEDAVIAVDLDQVRALMGKRTLLSVTLLAQCYGIARSHHLSDGLRDLVPLFWSGELDDRRPYASRKYHHPRLETVQKEVSDYFQPIVMAVALKEPVHDGEIFIN